ncbi:MAG: hypothetical protein IRY96_07625, partial [Burkholderiales bacterium]|nr:hypothetical protein [Burkholderiales bacterium]
MSKNLSLQGLVLSLAAAVPIVLADGGVAVSLAMLVAACAGWAGLAALDARRHQAVQAA